MSDPHQKPASDESPEDPMSDALETSEAAAPSGAQGEVAGSVAPEDSRPSALAPVGEVEKSAGPRGGLPPAALVAGALLIAVASLWIGVQWGQSGAPEAAPGASPSAAPTTWTCSMHPSVKLPEAGACPLCGMDLIPLVAGGSQEPRVLELSEAAAALAEVETVPVERRSVAREVRMVGMIEVDETRLHYVTAWFPGRLDRLFVDYTGTLVREGDHLAEVYSPELLTAQEELLQAVSAEKKLAASSSEFLRKSAAQTLRSSREKLRLWGLSAEQIASIEREGKSQDHVTIHATSGGVVVHKNKNRGEYVKTGERIYAIADLSQVWVKLDAYESDLSAIHYGQEVSFGTEAYPGQTFRGQVVFVDPVVSGHTRTVKVRLNVANPEGRLKPGMFVRATLQAPIESDGQVLAPAIQGKWICPMHREEIHDEPGKCSLCAMPLVKAESLFREAAQGAEAPLVIPASAVLWTGVRSVVYVKRPESHAYEGREVVLGPRAGGVYLVREGLEEGELVVTKGAFKLDSALQIEARPSMMLPPAGAREPVALEVPPAFRDALDPVYQTYLEAQSMLARDQLDPARAGLRRLREAVEGIGLAPPRGPTPKDATLKEPALRAWVGLAKRLRDAGAKGAAAGDLGGVRAAFQQASQAILELEKGFGHARGRFVEAYCPMAFDNAGAAWLQVGEELNNPYFGASMLRCGDVKARFGPRVEGPTPNPKQTPPAAVPTPSATPGGTEGALRGRLGALVEGYLALHQDLSKDRARGGSHAQALKAALGGVSSEGLSSPERGAWSEAQPKLEDLVQGLAAAKGIESERRLFHELSKRLDALLSRVGTPLDVTLRRFHCSMAFGNTGANWLQASERTENPYFGSGMYRCGDQVKVLEAQPQGASEAKPEASKPELWTCGMHPEVRASGPGDCPKCGMQLERAPGGGR